MKRISFLLVMLVFGLTFMSCWTTGSVNEPTPFEGRWLDQISVGEFGYTDLSYTFTGNTFLLVILNNQGNAVDYTYAGSFKYTKSKIQFTSFTYGEKTWTQEYTLTGSELNLARRTMQPSNRREAARIAPVAGVFIRQ
jgi:hypothetical protein